MTATEMLKDIALCADRIIASAEQTNCDDEARTLDLVCLHHRMGLVINSYSQTRAVHAQRNNAHLLKGV